MKPTGSAQGKGKVVYYNNCYFDEKKMRMMMMMMMMMMIMIMIMIMIII